MSILDERLINKIRANTEKIGDDLREFPENTDGDYLKKRDKALRLGHIFNWTQSFFVGTALWAYLDTMDKKLLGWAESFYESYYKKVFETPMETMHDLGFLYSPYAVMLYGITNDEKYKKLALKTAVVLSAILEIERYKTDSKLQKYKRLLSEKLEEYVNYDENVMGILRGQNGRNVYTSFGDYYLIESRIKDKMSIKVW